MFGKKSRIEDQVVFCRRLTIYVYVNKQASPLVAPACTAEVSGLKRDLERSEEELGLTKRQLEENKGKRYPVCIFIKKKWFLDHGITMNFARGHD